MNTTSVLGQSSTTQGHKNHHPHILDPQIFKNFMNWKNENTIS